MFKRVLGVLGFAPADEVLLFRQKDPKPFSPWSWPWGSPARFANSGGCATRYAQTVLAENPGVGCTARPHHKARKFPIWSHSLRGTWSHQHLIGMTMPDGLRRLLHFIRRLPGRFPASIESDVLAYRCLGVGVMLDS